MIRRAQFAGSWYPGRAEALRREVERFISAGGKASAALGLLAPHAGYVYSGSVAGRGYAAVDVPRSVIVIAPAHRHARHAVSVWTGGPWQTPLGEVPIDEELRRAILEGCACASGDDLAHQDEHSLELQLPFLQVRRPDVAIVPIVVATRDPATLRELGVACARAARERKGISGGAPDVLVVASSDMTHYESAGAAKRKDELALAKVLALDPDGLLDTVERNGISMCGASPAAAMLHAAKELGAGRAEVVAYGTSGDVTGDESEVVGYAAVAIRQA